MAKFGSSKKPANQGSHAAPRTAAPKKSSSPARTASVPTTKQTKRGYKTPGNHGTGKGTR